MQLCLFTDSVGLWDSCSPCKLFKRWKDTRCHFQSLKKARWTVAQSSTQRFHNQHRYLHIWWYTKRRRLLRVLIQPMILCNNIIIGMRWEFFFIFTVKSPCSKHFCQVRWLVQTQKTLSVYNRFLMNNMTKQTFILQGIQLGFQWSIVRLALLLSPHT